MYGAQYLLSLIHIYRESVNTAPHYRLYRLDTVPEKPGMVYDDKKGAAIAVCLLYTSSALPQKMLPDDL